MPLLDIATARPSFQNHLSSIRSQTLYHPTFLLDNERRFPSSWISFQIPKKVKKFNVGLIKMPPAGLLIKAVATLEPKCSIQDTAHGDYSKLQLGIDSISTPVVEHQSSSEASTEPDEREKLRRMRISKANKGNTPWNKGRKHSPETLQRIRERTRLAMQDPKVKMKLVNLGHAQSKETRIKIGVGVRIGWNRRREKLMLQETCHFEWQNLIAGASRRGFVGEEELQWDSYKILDEQLEQEWLESVEQRKKTPRLKGSKRAPKSPEQRRKISEAIAAKWADPAYRDRVYSGLSKYHGTPVGIENPRRRHTSERQPRKANPAKKKGNYTDNSTGNDIKIQNQRTRLKRSSTPLYKDPLASSKLEMIKRIRAQRENKKTEAIMRAKLLIAEAEKAAKSLEVAAARSSLARDSLIETRKLIAEAIQSIESIETGEDDSDENGICSPCTSTEIVNLAEKERDTASEVPRSKDQMSVNGARALASNNGTSSGFGFENMDLQDLVNGMNDNHRTTSCDQHDLVNGKEVLPQSATSGYDSSVPEVEHAMRAHSFTKQLGRQQLLPNGSSKHERLLVNGEKSETGKKEKATKSVIITKRWVRGKLVELSEED